MNIQVSPNMIQLGSSRYYIEKSNTLEGIIQKSYMSTIPSSFISMLISLILDAGLAISGGLWKSLFVNKLPKDIDTYDITEFHSVYHHLSTYKDRHKYIMDIFKPMIDDGILRVVGCNDQIKKYYSTDNSFGFSIELPSQLKSKSSIGTQDIAIDFINSELFYENNNIEKITCHIDDEELCDRLIRAVSIIDKFDFTVDKFIVFKYNEKYYSIRSESFRHALCNKELEFDKNYTPSNPLRQYFRVLKYHKLGYSFQSSDSLLRVLNDFVDYLSKLDKSIDHEDLVALNYSDYFIYDD